MIAPASCLAQSRHHLLWLSEPAWVRLQAQCSDARQVAALAYWQRMRWPVIVRRLEGDVADDEICVGIALPPDAQGNKPRIALRVQAHEVVARHAPFLLRDIVAAHLSGLPPAWQSGLDQLQQHMARAGITLAVFGSLAWQALTAEPYLRSSSDIDLLFQPRSVAQLEAGVRLLAWQAMFLPLDGEVMFPEGAAVSWKEWRQVAVLGNGGEGRVLVKRAAGVALERVATLIASLPQEEPQSCVA
ncbi:malonate decarboxylase holo-[acyl-carrier-protein] synthase [Herbaspirillum rubrisubalbicans]|uniref:malonate decarboxylase holo-[acyl-carrier-protein] synthase n=1 Tax=Herbaspirillum rubrisubalbicans TaxID=80842 RepID=UPI00155893B1|nr:malonate decarboxylase holo-[acyl-carrier-protein] synthase [Herbaspirillum rubrisubalbicans]NQE47427.1 phosphoribosyl-dephospho-CoA transferase [Herbaspirillum rubrisubalbicans]